MSEEFECTCTPGEPGYCNHWKQQMGPETKDICASRTLLINGVETPYDRSVYVQTWSRLRDKRLAVPREGEVDTDALRFKHPCTHLVGLTSTGERAACGCGSSGNGEVDVYGCDQHAKCTICAPARELRLKCCKTIAEGSTHYCDKYEPDTSLALECMTNGTVTFRPIAPQITFGMAVGAGEEISAIWATIYAVLVRDIEFVRKTMLEVVVVDCTTDPKQSEEIKRVVTAAKVDDRTVGRYSRYDGPPSTSGPRNAVFAAAKSNIVVCVDPHVILYPGCLENVYNTLVSDKKSLDLLVGTIVFRDSGSAGCTRQDLTWGKANGILGVWGKDPETPSPTCDFEVPQQGLGFFASRKEAWDAHGGFHPEATGFGGCETYLCENVRRYGGRVLSSRVRKWHHRFVDQSAFTVRTWSGTRYQTYVNYLLGFFALPWIEKATECVTQYRPLLSQSDLLSGLNAAAKSSRSRITSQELLQLQELARSGS